LSSQSIAPRPVKFGGALDDRVDFDILTPYVRVETPSIDSVSEPDELFLESRPLGASMPAKRRKMTSTVARSLTT